MRQLRKLQDKATYHVIARANLQEFILKKDYYKDMFLNVVMEAKRKYSFRLIHFAIMSNHIHLLMKPIGEPRLLSGIMRWILSVFATRFNKELNRKGHVWYDRFKSSIIDTKEYFTYVFEYISNNPVKAKLTDSVYSYPYSGIFHLVNKLYDVIDKPTKEILTLFNNLRR